MGMTGFHLVELVLDFASKESSDDENSNDVDEQNHPRACRPRVEHVGPSNWRADVNVHIASWLPDAAEACSFLYQPIVKARWEFFGKRDFTKDQTDHAGAAGARSAICWQFNPTGFGMFNDGFTGIHCALAKQVWSSKESDDRGWRGGHRRCCIGAERDRTCGHECRLNVLFLESSDPFAC